MQQIAPATVADPTRPTELTISGENFIGQPAVRLGAQALSNVQLIDEHSLKATVPAGMLAGRYDLRLSNPGGQTAISPDIVVGKLIFLPAMAR